MTGNGGELFERNTAAFQANHATTWQRLAANQKPVTTVVEIDGVASNAAAFVFAVRKVRGRGAGEGDCRCFLC